MISVGQAQFRDGRRTEACSRFLQVGLLHVPRGLNGAERARSRTCTCQRALRSSIVLASQTVQVTTDAMTRPIMTAFTTTSAFMNMPHGERSRGRTRGCLRWAARPPRPARGRQAGSREAHATAAARSQRLQYLRWFMTCQYLSLANSGPTRPASAPRPWCRTRCCGCPG